MVVVQHAVTYHTAFIVSDTADATFTSADDTVLNQTLSFGVIDTAYTALCTGTYAVLNQAVANHCRSSCITLFNPYSAGIRSALAVTEMAVLHRHVTTQINGCCTPGAMFCILEYQTVDHDRISRGSIVFHEQPRGHTRTIEHRLVQLRITLAGLSVVTAHVGCTALRRDSLVVHTFGDEHRVTDAHMPNSLCNRMHGIGP